MSQINFESDFLLKRIPNSPHRLGVQQAGDVLGSNAIGFVAQLNLAFPRRKRPGLSCHACPPPHLLTAAFLTDPNASLASNQTWPVPRIEKRSGALLDRFGHLRLKSTKLQFELNRDSSQTDFATKT
jgi:hypothetical protein